MMSKKIKMISDLSAEFRAMVNPQAREAVAKAVVEVFKSRSLYDIFNVPGGKEKLVRVVELAIDLKHDVPSKDLWAVVEAGASYATGQRALKV